MLPGNFIFSKLKTLPSFDALVEGLHSCAVTNVSGLEEAASSAVIGTLQNETGEKFIILCDTDHSAHAKAEDLNELGIRSYVLSGRDISFMRADAASKDITQRRLQALGDFLTGKLQTLVVTADAMLNILMPPEVFRSNILEISVGDICEPADLMQKLVDAGYERVEIVEGRGQCSLRGGILDVFAIGMANAVRLEFFSDEIDSMREFDVLTQRSLGNVKKISVYPASELLLNADQRKYAADKLEQLLTSSDAESHMLDRQRSLETEYGLVPFETFFAMDSGEEDNEEELPSMWDLKAEKKEAPSRRVTSASGSKDRKFSAIVDALRSGRTIDKAENLLPLVYDNPATIFDYLDNGTVIIERCDRIRERCAGTYADYKLIYESSFERGEALAIQSGLMLSFEQILPVIGKKRVITIDSFLRSQQDLKPQKLVKFDSVGSVGFSGNTREMVREIDRLKQTGASIALLCGGVARGQRLSKAFSDEDVTVPFLETIPDTLTEGVPVILPANLSSGFVFPECGLNVFCENDLFGKGSVKRRASTAADKKITAFTELNVGDYVVHENHGIGQYLGTVRLTIDGRSRDFLNIRYAGTDKLYVPTDQMDRIQKYIGSEGDAPKLNSLSGGSWQKQKAKVKRAIKEIAGDLINLYAERSSAPGYAFSPDTPWQREFEDLFPFEETPDQVTAIAEIKSDMERPMVMDRLLCGDVGYGKTEVAMRAIFKCIMDGKQAVLLAPTTILVQQHYSTALTRFANFPIRIDYLSRFKSAAEQKEIIRKLKTGEVDFVIGTHRLLSKEITYKDLGLLVVDEEQRFGVGHKEAIKQYKKNVDVLTLSATPIPRTLHMSMVGIRDMSVLKTPPEERYPVQTYVVEYSDGLVRDAILRELARGGQVYVLHNRVQSIDMMYARLKKLVPEARIAVGHGQMREQQLEDVMMDFYDGKFDVLLCTTIIEAGLDVPRANTLIVCDADRFGLSQLYQLRGRVGRSNRVAYAYLTVNPSKVLTTDAEKRLEAIREFTQFGSGFRVAMRDLEIRGTGNLLGAEQSGHMASVGYDLYIKMIDETIREMQGNVAPVPVQCRIDLTIDAYLPSDYVTTDALRIEMYKKIAEVHDDATRDDVIDELIDRFGDPDKPVMNLLNVSYIKSLCEKLYVENLSMRGDSLVMRFSEEANLDVVKLVEALSGNKRFKLEPRKPGLIIYTHEKEKQIDKILPVAIADLMQVIEKMNLDSEGSSNE